MKLLNRRSQNDRLNGCSLLSVYNKNSPDASAIWGVFDLVRWLVFYLVT
jgi:hypothetical protein